MYVDAFLFGIMCTLFVEMAVVIVGNWFTPKKTKRKSKQALKPVTPAADYGFNTYFDNDKEEVYNG